MSPTGVRWTFNAPAVRPRPLFTASRAAPSRSARPRARATSSSAVRPATEAWPTCRKWSRSSDSSGVAVLHEHRAVGHRERLVEAEDGPVAERPKRLPVHLAEQRERAILDEPHASPAAQIDERRHRLRPAEIVNHVEHVGVMARAEALDLSRIELHVEADRAVVDRRARGAHREHLVAAVVVRGNHATASSRSREAR